MEIVKDPDFSKYTAIDEMDTGDGLQITFYAAEDGASLLNLDWDEDSKWSFLNEDDIVASFTRMMEDLLGKEEAARAMKGKVIIPVEELERMQDAIGAKEAGGELLEEYEQLELPLAEGCSG